MQFAVFHGRRDRRLDQFVGALAKGVGPFRGDKAGHCRCEQELRQDGLLGGEPQRRSHGGADGGPAGRGGVDGGGDEVVVGARILVVNQRPAQGRPAQRSDTMNRLDRDEVRAHADVDAGTLYNLVSDVPRTPEWSPEVVSCAWLDGAVGPSVGARFTARNRRRWFSWSNKPVVEVADPGRQFTFTRSEPGGGTIRWSYRFEPDATGTPDASGTTVVLSYEVLRPVSVALHLILRLLFGVRDLRADLNQNMWTSLQRLADVAKREKTANGGKAKGEAGAQLG